MFNAVWQRCGEESSSDGSRTPRLINRAWEALDKNPSWLLAYTYIYIYVYMRGRTTPARTVQSPLCGRSDVPVRRPAFPLSGPAWFTWTFLVCCAADCTAAEPFPDWECRRRALFDDDDGCQWVYMLSPTAPPHEPTLFPFPALPFPIVASNKYLYAVQLGTENTSVEGSIRRSSAPLPDRLLTTKTAQRQPAHSITLFTPRLAPPRRRRRRRRW